jgi:hypothetical protein
LGDPDRARARSVLVRRWKAPLGRRNRAGTSYDHTVHPDLERSRRRECLSKGAVHPSQ